jgi:hypothetical protein
VLLVIIPGVATVATIALFFPAAEMMAGRSTPTFPRFLSKRPFHFKRLKRFTERVQPALRAIESVGRPRWTIPHAVAGRLVGLGVLLLALSAMWPLPLINVVPGIVIVLIAIAYLQEDGLLTVGAAAAALSLLGFIWTVWASGGALMDKLGAALQTPAGVLAESVRLLSYLSNFRLRIVGCRHKKLWTTFYRFLRQARWSRS